MDDFSVGNGGSLGAPVVRVGYAQMVEAQDVHDSGVQVVDVHRAVDVAQADLVGAAEDEALLHSIACHPHGEAPRVIVAAAALSGRWEFGASADRRLCTGARDWLRCAGANPICCHLPQYSSLKRPPCSTRRRASSQLVPNLRVVSSSMPYSLRVASDSLVRHSTSVLKNSSVG